MRLEQHVRNNGRFHLVRCPLGKARLRVRADIGIRPAVKGALLHAREVIGRKIIAKSVALLNSGVELAGGRVKRERGWVAHSRRKRGLTGAIRLEALN